MAVVAFDLAGFRVMYPEFSAVSDPQLTAYFTLACVYLDNTDCSPVEDLGLRSMFLNMLVAHIAQLHAPTTSQGAAQLVGRISNAKEGSVSVSADMPGATASSAWFLQTKYGADYWEAISTFRQARYVFPVSGGIAPFGGPAFPFRPVRW